MSLLALVLTALAPAQETHIGAYAVTLDAVPRPVAAAFGPRNGVPEALFVAIRGDGDTPPAVIVFDAPLDGSTEIVEFLGGGSLERPAGVAVAGDGGVFVTDVVQRALWRFSADDFTGVRLDEPGTFVLPGGVDVHTTDDVTRIAVADEGDGTVKVHDSSTGKWTTFGADELVRPVAASFYLGENGEVRIAVTDAARHAVELYRADGKHVASFGEWGPFPGLLSSPAAIDAADGLLFVADTENHRVQAFDPRAIDGKVGRLAYRFGIHAIQPGEGEGALHYPSGLAIDADASRLALVETLDDRVQIFGRAPGAKPVEDPARAAIGPPAPHFGPPLSLSGQYMATVSPESHRVQIYDLRIGEPVRITEAFVYGERLGMLRGPVGAVLSDGGRSLLTIDEGNRRLTASALRVKPDEPLAQDPELAAHGWSIDLEELDEGPFVPRAVAEIEFRGEQCVAIANAASDTVAVLEGGELVATLRGDEATGPIRGIGGITSATVADRTTGASAEHHFVVDSAGAGDGQEPGGRVLVFDVEGRVLQTFGEGLLAEPCDVATDGATIWVTDVALDRVHVFRYDEEGGIVPVRDFGERGLGKGQFHGPRGVAFTPDAGNGEGRFVVMDHGNHRGQIFDAEGNFVLGFGSRLYVQPLKR